MMRRRVSVIWKMLACLPVVIAAVSCNPFAPAFDDEPSVSSLLGDPATVDGVFQNVKYAYTFRDTTIYGQLVSSDFTFIYRDYDRGADVSWGRDEEMRITSELFRNVQRIDLIWNDIIALSTDTTGGTIRPTVSRNFNLTVTFNPSDIIRVDGYASLTLGRVRTGDPWKMVRWRDESNF